MAEIARGRFQVLVLGEDENFVSAVKSALAERVDLTVCKTPAVALKAVSSTSFHVICADLQQGSSTGIRFLQKALPARDAASLLLIASAGDLTPLEWKDLPKEIHVLRKPFDAAKLTVMVIRLAEMSWADRSIRSLEDTPAPKPGGASPGKSD
jgi:DNA-binding NtrC family response regulator